MKTRKSFGSESDATEINISPLIDMVFILLIFFIVTTVFVEEEGFGVNRPEPSAPTELDKENVLIEVHPGGQILHNGSSITASGVFSIVKNAVVREQVPVLVQVWKKSSTDTAVQVIDEARRAGAENISLTTGD